MITDHNLICSVCGGASSLLDVVDFNKSCAEPGGVFLPISGIPVYYALCGNCGFCFAPELMTWGIEEFKQKIYNEEYVIVDPDYVEARPRINAEGWIRLFGNRSRSIKHLDYGGGTGLFAKILGESNWPCTSYDPLVDVNVNVEQLGKFDLITAFEVFEHVPNVNELMSNLRSLLADDGVLLFSTLLSDGSIHSRSRLNWWYASPRNGHISLFSKKSLLVLAQKYGFNYGAGCFGPHVFFTKLPAWAGYLVGANVSGRSA
jgi:SAM-dependent methyltransferase